MKGLDAEALARLEGVAASTGSACHSGQVELSPVLAATGVPERIRVCERSASVSAGKRRNRRLMPLSRGSRRLPLSRLDPRNCTPSYAAVLRQPGFYLLIERPRSNLRVKEECALAPELKNYNQSRRDTYRIYSSLR
jgi:hypothetical protein